MASKRIRARDLRPGDRLSLRPSASLGAALDAKPQNVEVSKVKKEASSGGCRVTVWVAGKDSAYAYLRGSTTLIVERVE